MSSVQVNLCCRFCSEVVSSSSKGNESWRKYSIWTYIFIIVWVLVLGLFRCRNLTVGAVVLTVVKRSAMVRDNHQLLDVTLETKKSTVRTSENSTQQIWRIAISLYSIQAMNETSKTSRESKTSSYKTEWMPYFIWCNWKRDWEGREYSPFNAPLINRYILSSIQGSHLLSSVIY